MQRQSKEKRAREYKVPSRRQPFFAPVKWIFKLFLGCKIVNEESNPLPERAILISNHSAKSGPMALEVSLPVFNVKWGAHEMLGNYRSRYNYLRNVLYIKKLKKGKLYSTVKAFIEAIFSLRLYRGMKFIGTYTDIRFASTVKDSMKVLDANASVLIFPEDSNEGYLDVLTSAFPGFAVLAKQYKKRREEVPVIPLYYHKKSRRIFVGKAFLVSELEARGMTQEDIAEYGKDRINELYFNNISDNTRAESD